MSQVSTNREFDGHFHEHVHRLPAACRRREFPLLHRGYGARFQAAAEALDYADIADVAIATHDNLEQNIAPDVPASRLVGVFRLPLAQEPRRLDAAAGPV